MLPWCRERAAVAVEMSAAFILVSFLALPGRLFESVGLLHGPEPRPLCDAGGGGGDNGFETQQGMSHAEGSFGGVPKCDSSQ